MTVAKPAPATSHAAASWFEDGLQQHVCLRVGSTKFQRIAGIASTIIIGIIAFQHRGQPLPANVFKGTKPSPSARTAMPVAVPAAPAAPIFQYELAAEVSGSEAVVRPTEAAAWQLTSATSSAAPATAAPDLTVAHKVLLKPLRSNESRASDWEKFLGRWVDPLFTVSDGLSFYRPDYSYDLRASIVPIVTAGLSAGLKYRWSF